MTLNVWKRARVSVIAATGLAGVLAPAASAGTDEPYAELQATIRAAAIDVRGYWESRGVTAPNNIPVVMKKTLNDLPCALEGGVRDIPAWACQRLDVIVVYLPNMERHIRAEAGTHGVYTVIGHEFGHLVLPLVNDFDRDEYRATCAAGAFMRDASKIHGWDEKSVDRNVLNIFGVQQEVDSFDQGWSRGVNSCKRL